MKKGKVMTGAGILVIIAVAAVQYAGTQSFDGAKLENNGALEQETKDESTYRGVSESFTKRKPGFFVYDTKGVDARYTSSPERAYHYISKCYARKSFEAFFNSSQGDPTSIFNDKAKLESLSDVKRSYLESDLNMMASSKKECAEWDSKVDKDTASQQVYGSALNAAIAGEDDATACLIFNPWKLPEKTSRQFIELRDSFKDNAAELIQRGIKNGNWKVVAANVMAFRERNGLGAVVPGNDATGYYFARLAQLGSSNSELSSSYGYDASNFAKNSSEDDIERADQKAKQDFEAFFAGSKLSEEDITVRCGK
ncbi:hypothetical protein [Xanthomonas vesicatoria]|uniref:Uncharacterized protein n=1 Tax=Xanthomonas vesicatoria TaxID=56460 RepID=A0ABS8LFQ1_9XANT|nr:hypothetical protein [Xanthomonas vesicatoria]MCC8624584.1 hypothetical protein [Xanthomonas vesicatoria]MCC8693460.1 hypothetical protein [Xanthomonas vesicatoria]MCC8703726.1 hypothetical protein [Xanthomonas vesicatoria]MDG4489853.1 hypothetical protein [Xanthomonas vesicatoria]